MENTKEVNKKALESLSPNDLTYILENYGVRGKLDLTSLENEIRYGGLLQLERSLTDIVFELSCKEVEEHRSITSNDIWVLVSLIRSIREIKVTEH